jgi:hypothetical protein
LLIVACARPSASNLISAMEYPRHINSRVKLAGSKCSSSADELSGEYDLRRHDAHLRFALWENDPISNAYFQNCFVAMRAPSA